MSSVKSRLKRYPLFAALSQVLRKRRESRRSVRRTALNNTLIASNIIEAFPLFAPNSSGTYDQIAPLAFRAINQTFPNLKILSEDLSGWSLQTRSVSDCCAGAVLEQQAQRLKVCFDRYGSDKATIHNYHLLYAEILAAPESATRILEVGMGTNNTDVASNMGSAGKPGASLRAFRDFCPNARVFGADIDHRILFSEERIESFFVDQTNYSTLQQLAAKVGEDFDLVIDDGLHSTDANILTLLMGLRLVKIGGWVVIEDIPLAAVEFWQVVAHLLPNSFEARLFEADSGFLFAVRRVS